MQAAPGASLTLDGTSPARGGRRRTGVLLAVAAVVLVLDQVTKIIAVARLEPGQEVPVFGDILQLRLIRNPGAAFSLATDMTPVLAVVAVVVILVIVWVSRRVKSLPWAYALGGVLGGAMGTLTDRVFRAPAPFQGHVVDFLELPNWPVFNLADSAIVGGAVLVAVLTLRGVSHDGSGSRRGSNVGGRKTKPTPADGPGRLDAADGPSRAAG